jgi:glycosyltransferase involved in cell wall biosynthesis
VLVSRRETWGVVVNEAMAAGLPLVLSEAVGASGDLLEAGGNGELVPAGDVHAIRAALRRLAADPDMRRRYGERSRRLIDEWSYELGVEAFDRAVRRAVKGARRRRRTSPAAAP